MRLVEAFKDEEEIHWEYEDGDKASFDHAITSLVSKGYKVEAFEVEKTHGAVTSFTAIYVSDWED
jgi:hypothetical protein